MFEIRDLSIKVKDRYLIKGLNLILDKGDKLAIIMAIVTNYNTFA